MWLVLSKSTMSKGEQELMPAGKSNEQGNRHEVDRYRDQQKGDEFDEDFWIKVMKLFCYVINPLSTEFELFKQVHQMQNEGFSWNRAMDQVHVERVIQKYKDGGELVSEDPALLMLKKWPVYKQYKDDPDKLLGLEQQVGTHKLYLQELVFLLTSLSRQFLVNTSF